MSQEEIDDAPTINTINTNANADGDKTTVAKPAARSRGPLLMAAMLFVLLVLASAGLGVWLGLGSLVLNGAGLGQVVNDLVYCLHPNETPAPTPEPEATPASTPDDCDPVADPDGCASAIEDTEDEEGASKPTPAPAPKKASGASTKSVAAARTSEVRIGKVTKGPAPRTR